MCLRWAPPRRVGLPPTPRAGPSIPIRHVIMVTLGGRRRSLAACMQPRTALQGHVGADQPAAGARAARGHAELAGPPVFYCSSVAQPLAHARTHAHRVAGAARRSIVERTATRMGPARARWPLRPLYAAGLCRVAESLRERGHLRQALPRRPGGFSTPACLRPPPAMSTLVPSLPPASARRPPRVL